MFFEVAVYAVCKVPLFQNYTTPKIFIQHLYLHRFRRKPAITKFDKPFTPNHNSHQNFATFTILILKILHCQSDHG